MLLISIGVAESKLNPKRTPQKKVRLPPFAAEVKVSWRGTAELIEAET